MIEVLRDGARVQLRGEATIHSAAELQAGLRAAAEGAPEPAALDLGGLTELDTAGAQLLLAFAVAAPKARLVSCPPQAAALLDRLGFSLLLGIDRRAP